MDIAEPGVPEAVDALGAQLRALRHARGLSLQMLADATGLSIAAISQIERSRSSPSVRSLRALAEALGVTVGFLFHDGAAPPAEDGGIVLRRRHRRRLRFEGSDVVKELLNPTLGGKLEMLVVRLAPGDSSGIEPYVHVGEEMGLVLDGVLDLWVDAERYRLEAGDSFGFASTRPHRFANPGAVATEVLWVITPPGF